MFTDSGNDKLAEIEGMLFDWCKMDIDMRNFKDALSTVERQVTELNYRRTCFERSQKINEKLPRKASKKHL